MTDLDRTGRRLGSDGNSGYENYECCVTEDSVTKSSVTKRCMNAA